MEDIIQEDNLNQASTEFNIRQLHEASDLILEEQDIPFNDFLEQFNEVCQFQPETTQDIKSYHAKLNLNINKTNILRD